MIVTLRLAEEKIKESQVEKGGMPPRLCGLLTSLRATQADEFASGRERLASVKPGRQIAARQSVAPQHLVAHTHANHYIPGDLSTGYPQLIIISYIL